MALAGVNLGGWLVLERWITPSLFAKTDATDEWGFMRTNGAARKIRAHHRGFIKEADFRWLCDHDVRLVRIPVGYWIFGDEPEYVGAIDRLDWAFDMAAKYDLQILISLHGAPGGQNGEHHSGRAGDARWFRDEWYKLQTLDVLKRLSQRYRIHESFWGLELLNEPASTWRSRRVLRRFYQRCYEVLVPQLESRTRIVFSDAFRPRLMSGALSRAHRRRGVMMDVHWYHFGTWTAAWSPLGWYYKVLQWRVGLLRRLRRKQEVVVGEWSGAITQRVIDRYPESQHKQIVLDHVRRQLRVYAHAEAWCYWTYRHEHGGIWSLRSLVDDEKVDLHLC